MSKIHPYIKIVCVALLCTQFLHVHLILFNPFYDYMDVSHVMQNEPTLKVGAALYVLVFFFFTYHYFIKRKFLKLVVWIILAITLGINGTMYYLGNYPPIYIQYSQSASVCAFAVLCLFSREPFPNWERIFAVTTLIVLIPCLVFYFNDNWFYYHNLIYIMCFLPVILSFKFLTEIEKEDTEVLDN